MAYPLAQSSATAGLSPVVDPDVPPIDVSRQVCSADGTMLVCLSLAVKFADAGKPSQPRCSEMLHWDEYRAERNVSDGTPQMMQCFATPDEDVLFPILLSEGDNRLIYQSSAVDPCLAGSSCQPFCTEMLHWDDVSESKGNTGAPPPANTPNPTRMCDLFRLIRSERRWLYQDGHVTCEVSTARFSGPNVPICSEMLHWTDLQTATPPK